MNGEFCRRERVIRIFPNVESTERLIGALLIAQDEVWSTGRRYFDVSEYWRWKLASDRYTGTETAVKSLTAV